MHLVVRRSNRILARSVALLSVLLVAASCGGGGTEPATPGSITISPFPSATIAAGANLQLSFTVLDTNGQPLGGQTVTFTTNASNIATVSSQGQITAVGPTGTAAITASVGSANATLNVTVVAGPNSSITRTSPDPGTVAPGATAGDSVRFVVRDAFANPRSGETVTFSVPVGGGQASPASATTDAQGRVATQFTTGSASAGASTITSISPSPMTPGASVTIGGSGFNPSASSNSVTVDAQAVPITSASATQLVITIPTTLACTPTHQANVQISAGSNTLITTATGVPPNSFSVNGNSATQAATLKMGVAHTLAVGSALVLATAADNNCTELSPGNGHYVVNVLDASDVPTSVQPYRFRGATSIPAGTSFSPVFTLRQAARAPASIHQVTSLQTSHSALHARMLEFNRSILPRMKSSFRAAQRSKVSSVRSSVVVPPPAVGSTRAFRIIKVATTVGATGSCNAFDEITARVVYVGTKGIIWEDVKAPLAGLMDDKFTALGEEFDTGMYPSDRDNFGDPLLTDPDTDNDGHLNMVFTPVIPSILAGFVVGCDFSPRAAGDLGSNFGENFYARVPSVPGTGFSTDNPEAFMRTMRPTIVHEVKHIARFGSFIEDPNQLDFEESWLEEGMAMTAEEVWARNTQYPGAAWKGNMTYLATLFRDVRPTQFVGAPFVMFDHYSRFYDYLDVQGTTSLFGRVADNDFVFYGVSWSFIRYNVDRYATSEATYLRGITNATVTGITNISQQSGADPTQILGNWSLALYLDENAAFAGNADVNFPSWNLRDIFGGMNQDFPQVNNFPKAFPLVPNSVALGDFSIDNFEIHGGSFVSYDLTALTANTRTIGLATSSGTPVDPSLHLVIARVQ